MAKTRVSGQDVLDGTITDADVSSSNKDGAAGTPSLRTLGTGSAQAAAGNDSRLSDSRAPTGTAGGDLGGTYPNPSVARAAGAFALAGVLTPPALSGDVDDYNPTGLASAGILRLDGSSGFYHIYGLAGGTAGRLLYVASVGANYHQIQLVHEAGTSTAANRLFLPGGGQVNWTIEQDSGLWLIYDGTISRWRILTDSGIYGGSFVTVYTNGGTMTLYGGIGTWTLTNHLRLVIAGITPEPGASLTTNDGNNTVSNPMTMQQSQPTNDTVVYANCSTVLEGLPLVIPAGQMLSVETGAVFFAKP